MNQNKFLNLIMSELNEDDFGKSVYMIIKPKQGWNLLISSAITEVLIDRGYTFITNSFSNTENPPLTVQRLINALGDYHHNSEIAFEIYAYDGKLNNQIVIASDIKDTDIRFSRDREFFFIEVSIDYIRRDYSVD